jgi:hypothetical protein
MAVGKLTPLGDPAPNAPQWFAAVEMIRLAPDTDWLHKATKEVAKFWRLKRERCRTSETLSRMARPASRVTTSHPVGNECLNNGQPLVRSSLRKAARNGIIL